MSPKTTSVELLDATQSAAPPFRFEIVHTLLSRAESRYWYAVDKGVAQLTVKVALDRGTVSFIGTVVNTRLCQWNSTTRAARYYPTLQF